jgi:hypothetical protein
MRTRAVVTAVLAAGLLVALASPAAAKGPVGVMITGPSGKAVGAGGSVEDPMPPAFMSLMSELGLWRALGSAELEGPGPFSPSPPDGLADDALGPRFRVDWEMYHGGTAKGDLVLTQYVYPSAPGGPVVYTPGGQPIEPYAPETTGGWARTTGDVTATLTALGVDLSARAPAAAPARTPARGAQGGTDLAPALAGAGAAVLAAVVAAAVVVRRRRGAPAAAG